MGHPAEDLRRQNALAVLTNQVQPAERWGQPCRAYNVCIRPRPAAALAALQESALGLEPSLLRVPEQALHANLVWLLPMHENFDVPKDELWLRHGPWWHTTLAATASRTSGFRLRFRHMVATTSAVIVVADEPNPVTALRRELIPVLGHLPLAGAPGGQRAAESRSVT